MKAVVAFTLVLALASASTTYQSSLGQQVGQTCQQNSVFNISAFDVSPWPPVAGQQITITTTGTFTSATNVGQIQYGLQGNQQWHFQYQNINQNYPSGQSATYKYQINLPGFHDQWNGRVTVHAENQQNVLACWAFQFTD